MKAHSAIFAGVFSVALLAASAANASVLYDNLNATSNGTDPVQSFGPLADSFSTGGSSFALSSVALKLDATAPDDGGAFQINLMSDNSTSPGSVLAAIATVSDSSLTGSLANYTFNLGSSYLLSANTRYWIELSGEPTGLNTSALWSWSLDTSGTGVAGEFFANSNGVFANENGPYQMQVGTQTAVPEPSSLPLLLAGLAALGGALYLARRKAIAQA